MTHEKLEKIRDVESVLNFYKGYVERLKSIDPNTVFVRTLYFTDSEGNAIDVPREFIPEISFTDIVSKAEGKLAEIQKEFDDL